MAGASLDDKLAAGDGDDRGDDAERRVRLCEAGALLDVELEERSRKWPSAGDARAAADAADLLAPERDHGSRAGALNAAPLRQNAMPLRCTSNGSTATALATKMCGADWFDGP